MEVEPGDKIELKGFLIEDDGSITPSGKTIIFTMPEKGKHKTKSCDQLFIDVSREEYLDFLQSYPRHLEFDCTGIVEPPLGSYNDFSLAPKWPESIVAKESREWLGPNGDEDHSCPGKYWKYFLRKNLTTAST